MKLSRSLAVNQPEATRLPTYLVALGQCSTGVAQRAMTHTSNGEGNLLGMVRRSSAQEHRTGG